MAQKKGNRVFVWIILILLFIGLLGFGTGGLSGNVRSIGSVGDKDLSVVQYQNALNQQIRAFEAQIGSPLTFTQAQQLGLDRAVLSQLVTQRTLDNEAARLGISVGDELVRDEVLRVPAFRDLSGNFDREAYASALSRSGLSEAEFETSIREDVSRTLLQGAVVGGIAEPSAYADTIVGYLTTTRDATWALVGADDLTEPLPGATPADLQAYYDENAEQFTRPEQRDISYVWLTPEMLQDEVEVDEAALRGLYEERQSEFSRPERRLVERLVYVNTTNAQAAADAIAAGDSDFEAQVAERGLDLADVDLGDVTEAELGAAGAEVFAAEAGAVVGPLNSSLGPALFRVNAVLAAVDVPFEEAAVDLREELAASRARRVIEDRREELTDLIAGGARLEDLAERAGMQQDRILWSVDSRDDIAAYDEFRAAAASVAEGDFPDLLEFENGGVFALRLEGVVPPSVPPLAEIEDEVRAAWKAAQVQEAVEARAAEIAGQISPLTGFEVLGLDPQDSPALTRRGFVEGTTPDFVPTLFEMALGEVRVLTGEDGALVLRLDAINAPDMEAPGVSAEMEAVADQAAAGIGQDVFQAFAATLQTRTDVQINEQVLQALHAQFQ